jgi:hypothetical protein
MGMFAGKAIADYHLSFADQNKQNSTFRCLHQTNGKFAISIFHLRQKNRSRHFPLAMFSIYSNKFISNKVDK